MLGVEKMERGLESSVTFLPCKHESMLKEKGRGVVVPVYNPALGRWRERARTYMNTHIYKRYSNLLLHINCN